MNKKNFGFSFAIGFRGQLIAFFEQLESCTLLLYFVRNKEIKEYIRGVNAWNSNLNDLKSQGALFQVDTGMNIESAEVSMSDFMQ
ncbi:hypothetical protein SDJN02_19630, partial [Cucurbita argyrosperma subsp. argyrosperma]